MARITKVDQWLTTGEAECKHHGLHPEWKFQPMKSKRRADRLDVFRSVVCRRCERQRTRQWNEKNAAYALEYRFSMRGHIMRLLTTTRVRAKRNGLPYELSYEWVMEQFERQGGKCLYTGRPFSFDVPDGMGSRRFDALSIDQFDAGKGYTQANSRLVGGGVNTMKYDIPFDEFVAICRDVAARFKNI